MIRTVNLKLDIPANRELHIVVPDDVPPGPVEITVVFSSLKYSNSNTLGKLANSEFFGMWRDREDISDSSQFARELREKGWLNS